MFGVTSEQLDDWEKTLASGVLPGMSVGVVFVGKPLRFGESLQFIGFKDTPRNVKAMDDRTAQLDMSRSDYLRDLVFKDLTIAL